MSGATQTLWYIKRALKLHPMRIIKHTGRPLTANDGFLERTGEELDLSRQNAENLIAFVLGKAIENNKLRLESSSILSLFFSFFRTLSLSPPSFSLSETSW